MLTLPPSVKIYVSAQPVDARKSFDGLAALVEAEFGLEPLLCGEPHYVTYFPVVSEFLEKSDSRCHITLRRCDWRGRKEIARC
jgi:hypothetical protein